MSLCFQPFPKFNGSLDGFDLKENEQFKSFQHMDSIFGSTKKIFYQIESKDDNRKKVLEKVRDLSDTLSKHFPESSTISPADFYSKMILHWKSKTNSLSDFLIEGSTVPFLKQLIAKDKKSFLVIVTLPSNANFKVGHLDTLVKHTLGNSFNIRAISSFHLSQTIEDHIKRDIVVITFLILAFFLLYILFTFRGILPAIYTTCVVLISLGASISLFNFFGIDINLVSLLVIPIVLILSLSDCMHMLAGSFKFQEIKNKKERVKKVLGHYFIPSFFSSATTSAAFFSFYIFNESEYIREFGLISSIALMLEFFLTFSVTPLLLFTLNFKTVYDKPFLKFSHFLSIYRKSISITLVAVLVISLFFIPKITIESNSELFFPEGSELKATQEEFKKNYYSTISLHVLVTSKTIESAGEDRLYDYVLSLSERLSSENDVINVNSATDSYIFRSQLGLPVNLYNVLGKDNPYFNAEKNTYHIEIHFSEVSKIKAFSGRLDKILKDAPKDLKISYSSLTLLMDEVNQSISTSLLKTLLTSGLAIVLVILILTRSVKTSLLSLIPNLIPLAFIVMIFYFFEFHFNIITALSMVIGLGLLDDDTVHILYRKLWLKESLEELSFSVLSSAVLLIGGFSLLMLSSFQPVQVFGWISALIFVIGVICELTIMEWILDRGEKK
jgi:predicted RND superfamily exporter protein